jgi:hypothetical protein
MLDRKRARTLDFVLGGVDLLEGGNEERCSLTGTVLGTSNNISTHEGNRDGLFLNWGRSLETFLVDAHQQLTLEVVVLETVSLCLGNVLLKTKTKT